jgi:hypothetical protein
MNSRDLPICQIRNTDGKEYSPSVFNLASGAKSSPRRTVSDCLPTNCEVPAPLTEADAGSLTIRFETELAELFRFEGDPVFERLGIHGVYGQLTDLSKGVHEIIH